MSVNSIISDYTTWTNSNGNTIGNADGLSSINYEDGILTFTENDGDVYETTTSLTDAQIQELAAELGVSVSSAAATAETTETTDYSENDLDTNKDKLAELQEQWDTLNSTAETIKETVEELSEQIKEALDAALEEQEEITKEEQARVKDAVAYQIEQFKKDKENGKDVSMNELESNIQASLSEGGFDEDMQKIVSDLIVTNTKMAAMDTLLTELGVINTQMKALDTEMTSLESVIAEQEAEAAEAASSCDPIGFTDESGTTYEFVIDSDGNGELSNFSEFLGSEDYFAAMQELDTSGDGIVDADELNAAGISVLVTDADGNQSLQSIAEAFGDEDISVDLNSYTEAEDGATAANGQTLLGNFDITVGDSVYEGYSTLDSEEYLLNNYSFTDEDPDTLSTDSEATEEISERTGITNDIDEFIEEYQAKLEEFEAQFENLTELLGLDEELVEAVQEFAETQGIAAAQDIIQEAEEEAEAAEEDEETDAVSETEGTNNEDADDEDEEDEEKAA